MLVVILAILIILLIRPKYIKPIVIPNLLTHEECEYIRQKAEPNLKVSTITEDMVTDYNVRKSETAWLDLYDERLRNIVDKCIGKLNIENCESLQVLRYKPGGFYIPHQDANIQESNRRKYTFIFALNDEYEGGETSFPNLKNSYKLRKGDALFFNTLDTWGRVDARALHGGEPVKMGEKWVCNLWVRQSKYHP
jgi:prolyl 4-hydroxylase